jgi:hypothetical protein
MRSSILISEAYEKVVYRCLLSLTQICIGLCGISLIISFKIKRMIT